MKTFLNWAKERNLEIPTPEKVTTENTKRSGVRGAYPDAYIRAQYPDGYFPPVAADAPVQLQNAHKKS
jgi:hypothetical protein